MQHHGPESVVSGTLLFEMEFIYVFFLVVLSKTPTRRAEGTTTWT